MTYSKREQRQFGKEDYTEDEIDTIRNRIQTRPYSNGQEDVEKRINSFEGKGPECPKCGMKPAGISMLRSQHVWNQLTRYRCIRCLSEFIGKKKHLY